MKNMNKKGFTIVELVIVIAVIAILAAVLIPTFSNVVEKANESKRMQEVKNALTNYMANVADNGETVKAGLVFCYDEDHSATTLNDRTYYAYVNQALQQIDSKNLAYLDGMKNASNQTVSQVEYGNPAKTVTGDALKNCIYYTVTVNNSTWYGVTLDTGEQGYGSSGANKKENDNVFVCTGFIAVDENAAGSTWNLKAAATFDTKTLASNQFKITFNN